MYEKKKREKNLGRFCQLKPSEYCSHCPYCPSQSTCYLVFNSFNPVMQKRLSRFHPFSPSDPSMQRVYQTFFFFTLYFLPRLFHVLFSHSFLVPSPVHHMPSYNEKWNCGQIREQYGIQRVEAMFWAIERSVVLTQ